MSGITRDCVLHFSARTPVAIVRIRLEKAVLHNHVSINPELSELSLFVLCLSDGTCSCDVDHLELHAMHWQESAMIL